MLCDIILLNFLKGAEQYKAKKFEEVQSVNQEETDQLTKGEFEVVKELIAAYPEARKAKEKIDIIIDKCGLPPRGVGIQNLRECIMETKWKFDVSPEENQGVYKIMIIDDYLVPIQKQDNDDYKLPLELE